MTIHCVTPNPAVDVTYRVNALTVHAVNRIDEVVQRPGGKGVNVARLLAARDADVGAYGFLGGASGTRLHDLLRDLQPAIQQRWSTVEAETRLTIAVVDGQDTTMLNEPGRAVSAEDWAQLTAAVTSHCRPGDVVTISGSLPAGSNPAQLAALVAGSRKRGATVIVDTSGPGLVAAAEAGADVLKPNQHELLEVTDAADIPSGIDSLLRAGAQAAVVSLGADGLVLGTRQGQFTASLGRSLTGNPTGAGDALVAALAAELSSGAGDLASDLARALPKAVGWSAAAVLSPVAGEIDQRVADRLTLEVTTQEL